MSKPDDKPKKNTPKKSLQNLNTTKLSNTRIIQKHLVYVIGLSSTLANKEILQKYEYFGQYGTIVKIVVNKSKAYNPNGPNGPSYSAYISYLNAQEASIAILAIDNIEVDGHILRASYGTTKYCTFFLKNLDCPNKDCLYLHHIADDGDIINRDDMNSNTNIFYEQQLLAMKLSDLFNNEIKKKLKLRNNKKSVFPSSDTIYSKDIVIEQGNSFGSNGYGYDGYKCQWKKKYGEEYYGGSGYYEEYFGDEGSSASVGNCNISNNSNNGRSIKSLKDSSAKKVSSNFSSSNISNSNINSSGKFISKSKSPLTNKTKLITHESKLKNYNNSVSPLKIGISEVTNSIGNGNDSAMFTVASSNSGGKSDIIDKLDINANTDTNTPIKDEPKKLYRKRDESRFSFAKNSNCNLNVIKQNSSSNEYDYVTDNKNKITQSSNKPQSNTNKDNLVPDYVSDVIRKKISRYSFFKKFENYFEKYYQEYSFFEKDLRQNDSWSKFIISNMSNNAV